MAKYLSKMQSTYLESFGQGEYFTIFYNNHSWGPLLAKNIAFSHHFTFLQGVPQKITPCFGGL